MTTPHRLFLAGDRVRVQATLLDDWIGPATVSASQARDDPLVDFVKDNPEPGTYRTGFAHWRKLELIEGSPQNSDICVR